MEKRSCWRGASLFFSFSFKRLYWSENWANFERELTEHYEFLKSPLYFIIFIVVFHEGAQGMKREVRGTLWRRRRASKMGLLSIDLLITLQILPVFFSNCLFLALYDSVVLLKHMVLLLSCSKAARGEWRRMLTSEGLRCVWNSFLLDAYKQVGLWTGMGWRRPNIWRAKSKRY